MKIKTYKRVTKDGFEIEVSYYPISDVRREFINTMHQERKTYSIRNYSKTD